MSRRIRGTAAALALAVGVIASSASPVWAAGGNNDFSCRPSAAHPEPVVLLHGLGANKDEDINVLQSHLAEQGYCTFSLTYGAHEGFEYVGGLRPIADSAPEISAFVRRVLTATGAAKADLVGHSEGGFQALYVTKFQGIASQIAKVVSIAPPTHGTTFGGLYTLAYVYGSTSRELVDQVLRTFGCAACSELGQDGAAVVRLTEGRIAQPGVAYTIITSRYDEMVTPTSTSFVNERGVTNQYVQDFCPNDPVGHIGEAYDTNVWHLVKNALDPAHATPITNCSYGVPG